MGNTVGEKQVLEDPESNGMGTEVPEQFLSEEAEIEKTNGATNNGGDCERKGTLGQEGPKQHLADDTSILRCKGRIPVTILYTSREACLAKSSSFIRRNK